MELTLENYLMNVPTHLGAKDVFLKYVNVLVDSKVASQASSMHLFDYKLLDWPLENTQLVALE